jgi:hypothetical protein
MMVVVGAQQDKTGKEWGIGSIKQEHLCRKEIKFMYNIYRLRVVSRSSFVTYHMYMYQ